MQSLSHCLRRHEMSSPSEVLVEKNEGGLFYTVLIDWILVNNSQE